MRVLTLLLAFANLRVPFWPDNGAPVRATDMRASLNGKPAKVIRVAGPSADLIILLVADLVGDLSLADPARQALVEGIAKLPPNAYVGLLRAQDGLRVLADPGPDRASLNQQIRDLNISGHAGLLETVENTATVADAMATKSRARVAVFYVTDGPISSYREDFTNPVVNAGDARDMSRRFPEVLVKEKVQQVLAGLSSHQTPVFLVHLNHQTDRINEAYQTGLLEIATATGGAAEFCRSVSEIPEAVSKTFGAITSQHYAEIEFVPVKARQLEIGLATAKQGLRYRSHFQTR